mmetsp:Transcript_16196/g.46302  ORF Transcript_16196/g.46302 Transcript_16196/m.46302 type:complete len:223 (-) Transcript_16196:309-977(-)
MRRMASSKLTPSLSKRKACFKGISTEPTSPSSNASCAKLENTSSPSPVKAFCNHSATTSKATECSPGGLHCGACPSGVAVLGRCVQPPWPPAAASCLPPERAAFASERIHACNASSARRRSPSPAMMSCAIVAAYAALAFPTVGSGCDSAASARANATAAAGSATAAARTAIGTQRVNAPVPMDFWLSSFARSRRCANDSGRWKTCRQARSAWKGWLCPQRP